MAFKVQSIERSDIISITGAGMNEYRSQNAIGPVAQGGRNNALIRSNSGDYDGGDRVIGFPNGYEVDEDLLFTVGWGDGFAVRRLNNDGSLTKLYHDTNFLYRDTTSTYNHMTTVVLDKVNKKGVAMTYNVYGYTTFDYSGLMNSGSTFVKDSRPSHSNPQYFIGSQDTSNGYVRRVGSSYFSGAAAAGAWIYAHAHESSHYYKVMRKNIHTNVEERLDTRTSEVMYSGSATPDRAGYRGWVFYDEVNDRIYYCTYYNANFTLVLDASTSDPKTVWCDVGDTGNGDDGYEQGLHINDPVNEPNVVWIGGSTRILKLNITPCFSGSAPTVLDRIYVDNADTLQISNNFRFGTKYQKTSGVPMDKMPGYPDFIAISADRSAATISGFVDQNNSNMFAFNQNSYITEDTTTGGRGNSLDRAYSCPPVLMSSANGTKYWIYMGYGDSDGHQFVVYNENDHPQRLIGNWEIVFGTYTLDQNADINVAYVGGMDLFKIPSGCTLSVYVSNNNGTSWESYDKDSDLGHTFTTTGSSLRVKLVATGHPDKSPYYPGYKGKLSVIYSSEYEAMRKANIKFKIPRKRLR